MLDTPERFEPLSLDALEEHLDHLERLAVPPEELQRVCRQMMARLFAQPARARTEA